MSNFFNLTDPQDAERQVIWVLAGGGTDAYDAEAYNLNCEAAGIPTHGNLLGAEFKAARKAEVPEASEVTEVVKASDAKAAERTAAGFARRWAPKGRGNEAAARAIGLFRSGNVKSPKQAAYLATKAMKAEVTA